MITVRTLGDGHKSVTIEAVGFVDARIESEELLDINSLIPAPKSARIEVVQYAIGPELAVNVWWGADPETRSLITPAFGCGRQDYDRFGGRAAPDGWDGKLCLSTNGKEHGQAVAIMINLVKQG